MKPEIPCSTCALVMVRKRDEAAPALRRNAARLPKIVDSAQLGGACRISMQPHMTDLSGSTHRFGDYKVGEK